MPPERASDSDHWLHTVLAKGAVRADLKVQPGYLQKCFAIVDHEPWQAEMSGQLLSLVADIAARPNKIVSEKQNPSLKFRCVLFGSTRHLRTDPNVDVFHDATEDEAHANLVLYKVQLAAKLDGSVPDKVAHDHFIMLATALQACDADKLETLESLRSN